MSFSYNNNLATDLDKVRFNIGDTSEVNYNFQDEEINYLLGCNNTVNDVIINLLNNLITKYSLRANETVGRVSVSYQDIVSNLKQALNNFLTLNSGISGVYCGGISKTQKESYTENTDIVQSIFTRD